MMMIFLVVLCVLDLVLLGTVVVLTRRQEIHGDLLGELTQERHLIHDLHEQIKEDLTRFDGQIKSAQNKIQLLAAQVEQEVKASTSTLGQHLSVVVDELKVGFVSSVEEAQQKQNHLEGLLKKIDQQKLSLRKLLDQGQNLLEFFDKSLPYEEVLDRIAQKKYSDARHMLAKGLSPDCVAQDLGLSASELTLMIQHASGT